jgi:hypothetical protein
MKNRARMALKLGKVRVRQLGIRAGRLEAQAEALEERGDPCSLRKAEKLRERAAELRTAASDLKEKVKTEAKDLWDRGIRMAKALKCLGITGDDPDTEENELKLAGTQLRAIAERLSEIAEVCLDKAERLRALWEKLSEHGHGRRWLHLDDVI